MLIERIFIGSNANEMLDYNMPTTSITGEELSDRLKWCSYIVNEPNQEEIKDENDEE